MTRVYADMVADLFHYGHVEFLRQARALGDELVVGIHSDEAVETYKRPPIMTMTERIAVVRACRYVDEVIPDAPLSAGHDYLDRHRIDIVVHGDDFSPESVRYWYGAALERGILRLVPYTIGISTTDIIARLEREAREAP
jgi:cytidyltransferase-like protein